MSQDVDKHVMPTLKSGFITQGPKVQDFEDALQSYLGFEYGLTVNSGTSALMLALKLAGAGPGTNVVSTPMTCSATNEAIAASGADIIWADVNKYGNIDPGDVLRKINERTVAVMAVDWGGLPCDYDELRNVIDMCAGPNNNIKIIEDAAHAFGAIYKGQSVAVSGGDFVCYSFQAIKHITCGDGGLVVCPDEETYERGKLLRWFGLDRTSSDAMRSRQDIQEIGYKWHMNDISASIGLANLAHADEIVDGHRKIAAYYDFAIEDFRPQWPKESNSSFWLYTIHVRSPLSFETWAAAKGVKASQVHYRNDLYSCFRKYKIGLPNLNKFFDTMVCIPSGWWMDEEDAWWVSNVVHEWKRLQP